MAKLSHQEPTEQGFFGWALATGIWKANAGHEGSQSHPALKY